MSHSAGDPISSRRPLPNGSGNGPSLGRRTLKLHAQRPQEEPTIIVGDEDEDWAVLEQRRDFSDMEDAQSGPPVAEASQVVPQDSIRSDRWLKILAGFALLVAVFLGGFAIGRHIP